MRGALTPYSGEPFQFSLLARARPLPGAVNLCRTFLLVPSTVNNED
jgi:hypothetical protein